MKGKQIIGTVFVMLMMVLLAGCEKKEISEETETGEAVPIIEDMGCIGRITVSEEETLYAVLMPSEEDERYQILSMTKEGNQELLQPEFLKESGNISSITAIQAEGDGVYIAVDLLKEHKLQAVLYYFSPFDVSYEKIGEYPGYTNISKIMKTKQGLCLLAKGTKEAERQPVPASGDEIFEYGGEVLLYEDGTVLFDEFPVLCEALEDGNILMYAHEDGKGFYFVRLTVQSDKSLLAGEVIEKDLGQLTTLTMTGEDTFLYTSRLLSRYGLMELSLSNDVISEILPDCGMIFDPGTICYKNGNTYYRVLSGVMKLENASCKKDNKVIKIIQTENVGIAAPYGCGYQMEVDEKSEDEMSLTVLSQDSGYDIVCMQSGDGFGWSVKEKGNFYPLTEIEHVQEYLDACFPYLKEAATDSHGEIWMLPIAVKADLMLYSPEVLKQYGISWDEEPKLEQFLDDIRSIAAQGEEEYVSIPSLMFQKSLLNTYIFRQEDFDTKQFRQMAEMISGLGKEDVFAWHSKAEEALGKHRKESFVCGLSNEIYPARVYPAMLQNPYIRAMNIPDVVSGEPLPVKCYFLCVNMASDNMESAVKYISSLCQYLMEQTDSMMLKEKSLYSDTEIVQSIYKLYEKGEVIFNVPEELYESSWENYVNGKVTLDEMVKEMNRKVDMYRKE